MNEHLDKNYWSQRYRNEQIAWDAGSVTTPIKEYIDQLSDKSISILIPGAGNAYEAEYLHQQGFRNVTVLDISPEPLENMRRRIPSFPEHQLVNGDFFEHTGTYDLIFEQTFFCAIDPGLRAEYAKKMHSLLRPSGQLTGVLFNSNLSIEGPPFGGTKEEYLNYFQPYFKISKFEDCYNSIKPRAGKELFIRLQKK
ncbi:MAG: TPMT family class I SAM-dependent methyltransferase [Bacteroidota bacterium]|nr:TPMT family class I SAM-dependent methyltransferase [Bacteroidota bacterium]